MAFVRFLTTRVPFSCFADARRGGEDDHDQDDAGREVGAGHGERSRSKLLLKLEGAGNMRILAVNSLAVNSLAVNGALPLYVESKSVLYTQYSVKKCLVPSI